MKANCLNSPYILKFIYLLAVTILQNALRHLKFGQTSENRLPGLALSWPVQVILWCLFARLARLANFPQKSSHKKVPNNQGHSNLVVCVHFGHLKWRLLPELYFWLSS